MKKIVTIVLILLFSLCFVNSNAKKEFKKIIGSWTYDYYYDAIEQNDASILFAEKNYHDINQEGKGREYWHFLKPFQLIITGDTISFNLSMVGFKFSIVDIHNKNNKFTLKTIKQTMIQKQNVTLELTISNGKMMFESNEQHGFIYYNLVKMAEPTIIVDIENMINTTIKSFGTYTVTTHSTELREYDDTNADVVTVLNQNDTVYAWGIGKKEQIDTTTGRWVYVVTEDRKKGYCFSGYLQKVK